MKEFISQKSPTCFASWFIDPNAFPLCLCLFFCIAILFLLFLSFEYKHKVIFYSVLPLALTEKQESRQAGATLFRVKRNSIPTRKLYIVKHDAYNQLFMNSLQKGQWNKSHYKMLAWFTLLSCWVLTWLGKIKHLFIQCKRNEVAVPVQCFSTK